MSRGKKLTRMMVFLNIHHLAAHAAVGLESDLLAGSQVFSLTRPLLALILPAVGQGMLLGTTTASPPPLCAIHFTNTHSPVALGQLYGHILSWAKFGFFPTCCCSDQPLNVAASTWPGLWGIAPLLENPVPKYTTSLRVGKEENNHDLAFA